MGSPVFIYSFVFVHILTVQTQVPATGARKRRMIGIFTLLHVAGFETSLVTFETCTYIKYCLNSADITSRHLQSHLACLVARLSKSLRRASDAVTSFEPETISVACLKDTSHRIIFIEHFNLKITLQNACEFTLKQRAQCGSAI